MSRWLIPSLALFAFACSSEALDEPGAPGSEAAPRVQEPASPGAESPAAAPLGGAPRTDPSVAPYPSGPYGRERGSIIENLHFLGWRKAADVAYDPAELEVVSLSDFYDPDGSKGLRVLALNSSAVWCVVCRAEYSHIKRSAIYENYRPKGVEILGVLFEDKDYNPARPSDLVVWGGPEMFAVPFPLVIDPGFKTGAYFPSDATPMNMLIDTRTMEILDITMGYDASRPDAYWGVIDKWLSR